VTFSLVYGDVKLVADAGFGKVAHIPHILDSDHVYHRLGSKYLNERGIGHWNPENRFTPCTAPTDRSIKDYGDWLINFLEWAETRKIKLHQCEYQTHLIDRYQAEMLSGKWSRDGKALSGTTVNLRVQEACNFLKWMADKELRTAFDVPYTVGRAQQETPLRKRRHASKQRRGKAQPKKKLLRIPTDDEIAKFLASIYVGCDEVYGLMCETVLVCALRREEIHCWRVDTLDPNPVNWVINDKTAPPPQQRVQVTIKYGAKGGDFGLDNGDKVGPERNVWIPLGHAYRLHNYYMKGRNNALRKSINKKRSVDEKKQSIKSNVHLFLEEKTGLRVSYSQFYHAWKSGDLPYKEWTPHFARDWWACSVLWKAMQEYKVLLNLPSQVSSVLLTMHAITVIQIQISPALGHASEETTMTYLHWISDMLGFNIIINYELENEDAYEKLITVGK